MGKPYWLMHEQEEASGDLLRKVIPRRNKKKKEKGGRDRWEGKSRKKGREKRRKGNEEFSQRCLVGEEAFRYDYHSFTSLVNI